MRPISSGSNFTSTAPAWALPWKSEPPERSHWASPSSTTAPICWRG